MGELISKNGNISLYGEWTNIGNIPIKPFSIHDFGIIQVTSGKVIVSDPGYPIEEDSVILEDVKIGKYKAFGEFNYGGLKYLAILHQDYDLSVKWQEYNNAGVDSGTIGIFDISVFGGTDEWTEFIWDEVNSGNSIIDNAGVVVTTGGDGGFPKIRTK